MMEADPYDHAFRLARYLVHHVAEGSEDLRDALWQSALAEPLDVFADAELAVADIPWPALTPEVVGLGFSVAANVVRDLGCAAEANVLRTLGEVHGNA